MDIIHKLLSLRRSGIYIHTSYASFVRSCFPYFTHIDNSSSYLSYSRLKSICRLRVHSMTWLRSLLIVFIKKLQKRRWRDFIIAPQFNCPTGSSFRTPLPSSSSAFFCFSSPLKFGISMGTLGAFPVCAILKEHSALTKFRCETNQIWKRLFMIMVFNA